MNILKFARIVGKLKTTKRTGWLMQNIPAPESVADHSFRVTVLAMILGPKVGVNVDKVVKMALIHDLGEAIIGDIITTWGKKPLPILKEKKRKEKEAIKKIFSLIDQNEYVKLFDEYEKMKTKEAKFVKQIDRLEFALQALEYEEKHKIKFPKNYTVWPRVMITQKDLKNILDEIEKLRKANKPAKIK